MNNYFSRLIRQTGITFQSHAGSGAPAGMTGESYWKFETPERDWILETNMPETATGHSEQKATPGIPGKTSVTVSYIPQEETPQVETISARASEEAAVKLGAHIETDINNKIKNKNFQPEPGQADTEAANTVVSPEKGAAVRSVDSGEKNSHKQGMRFLASQRAENGNELGEIETSKNREIAENGRNGQDGKISLEGIRDWVARTPESRNEMDSRKVTKEVKFEESMKESSGYPGMREMREVPYHPAKSPGKGLDEGRDFNLSIGTISITIEDPGKQNRPAERPQIIEVQSSPGNDREPARLDRHYIRIK